MSFLARIPSLVPSEMQVASEQLEVSLARVAEVQTPTLATSQGSSFQQLIEHERLLRLRLEELRGALDTEKERIHKARLILYGTVGLSVLCLGGVVFGFAVTSDTFTEVVSALAAAFFSTLAGLFFGRIHRISNRWEFLKEALVKGIQFSAQRIELGSRR